MKNFLVLEISLALNQSLSRSLFDSLAKALSHARTLVRTSGVRAEVYDLKLRALVKRVSS